MPGQEKIKVLIVDDIADTRENIKRMVQFDQNIEVIGVSRSAKEAIELTQQLKPDVIIMDINMPDMDGITATEIIRKKVSFAQVVILSVQSDQNYMRRAMLAGARDFLSKPPMIDELTSAIRRAGAMAQEERAKLSQALPTSGAVGGGSSMPGYVGNGKIILVYSPKGGTGTTTIATNLSLALHTPQTRTVLVDGNLQFGDVAVFMNEQGKNSIVDLTPLVDELDPETVQEVMVVHQATGLSILASPPRPELAAQVTGEQFSKLIQYFRKLYAFVVIDTTPLLTDIIQSGLEVADFVVLITTQEIPALKNSHQFLAMADAAGIPRDHILFIMNKMDKRIPITPERIGESLKQQIVISIPFDERTPTLAVNRGVPFMIDNKSMPISKSIIGLAEIVTQKCKELDEPVEIKKPIGLKLF